MADKKILFIIPKNKKYDSLNDLAKSLGDHHVVIKNDEKSGYETLKRGGYDLVISSMFAGKLNGYELLSRIKKDKIDCGVILIMGDKKDHIKSDLKKRGVYSIVKKSKTGDELSKKIKCYFQEKESLIYNETDILECKKFALEEKVFELEQELTKKIDELKYMKIKAKEMYDEFQETKQMLQKKRKYMLSSERMISLGQMTASIVHEINNPLTVITSIAGLISLECKDDKITKYNKMLSDHIDNLRHYIHTVLVFSNPKKGEKLEDVDVNEAIDDLLIFYGYELKKKEIKLIKKYAKNLSKIRIPTVKLQQVILNILKNSSFAVRKKDPVISINTSMGKDHVIIEVKDNGAGIKKVELEEIFKPFFTTKSRKDGSGLGLYICKDIIEKYNGTIEVTSAYNKGTTVKLKLPVNNKP